MLHSLLAIASRWASRFTGYAERRALAAGFAALISGFAGSPASAAPISDTLTVDGQSTSIAEGQIEASVSLIEFIPSTNTSTVTIGLIEPNTNTIPVTLSDVVQLVISPFTLTVTVFSDTESASLFSDANILINEDGTTPGFPRDGSGFIDLTAVFNAMTGFQTPSGFIKVFSDIERTPPTVPAPATLTLLGLGLTGLAGLSWRKRRSH